MRRLKLARILQSAARLLPKKYPLEGSGHIEAPIFILGSGRNGSTLLNRILNEHGEIFIPPEQYFLGPSIVKFNLYNFLNWRDLAKIIVGELLPGSGTHYWHIQLDNLLEKVLKSEKNLQKVIDIIFRHVDPLNKKLWGDTTPSNTRYLPEIFSLFPKARYIFLIRDGRDVVASYIQGNEKSYGELCKFNNAMAHWKSTAGYYNWLNKRTDVYLLKYERLVTSPEEELRKLSDYLKVDYTKEFFHYHEHFPDNRFYHGPEHANVLKPIFSDSVGNWEKSLSEEQQLICNEILKKELLSFGYYSP